MPIMPREEMVRGGRMSEASMVSEPLITLILMMGCDFGCWLVEGRFANRPYASPARVALRKGQGGSHTRPYRCARPDPSGSRLSPG